MRLELPFNLIGKSTMANHGAYSNPGTQVRAQNKDFGAFSQTDLTRSLAPLWHRLGNYNRRQNELKYFALNEAFLRFTAFKRRKFSFSFPISSTQCSADVRATYRKKNKHPSFEWRGQGRGADSIVLWSYPIWVQCLNNFVSDCRCVMYQFRHYNVSRVLPSNYFFLLELCWKMFPKQRLCAVFGFQEWHINSWSVQFSLCGLQNQSSRRTHSG